jgi:hypothetical protein
MAAAIIPVQLKPMLLLLLVWTCLTQERICYLKLCHMSAVGRKYC